MLIAQTVLSSVLIKFYFIYYRFRKKVPLYLRFIVVTKNARAWLCQKLPACHIPIGIAWAVSKNQHMRK